ncbi:MAG: phosphinothricin acetyltransferase [Vibrio sp. MedPE-SWchi]|nr:MAG: phosphinothricin acetyltransferase [Vibrio sp. MedPE-SWchi]
MIREAIESDIDQMVVIYNHYVESTSVSFEEDPISFATLKERMDTVTSSGLPWLVVENNGHIEGYAYAGQWNKRSAYKYTVEPSIYLAARNIGKGIGRALYYDLLSILKNKNIKNAIGVIALPNPSSVALHEKLGFKKVGEFDRIGVKFGQEVSVGYWQLKLDDYCA